jgi:hypothetical protein
VPRFWGEPAAPYFENAMIARAMENAIYFASVNYALRYPQTATSLVGPDGACVGRTAYGEEALLVLDLDLGAATGVYARRPVQEHAALERAACRPQPLGALGEDDGVSLDPLQHALGEDHLLARDPRQGVEGDEGLRARPELAG